MKRAQASALLMVMTVMTGLTLLLTCWWQAAGWTGDLGLVRQRYITRFYATEVVRNYAVAWAKKSFDQIISQQKKTKEPMIIDGGVIAFGLGQEGKCTLLVDQVPGNDQASIVRVTVTVMVDGKVGACHRCLVERETIDGAPRFMVHHVAFH